MNWEALGAIGEIIGAIAVVVTLIYLAAQMKNNTAAIRLASQQTTTTGRADTLRFLSGTEAVSDLVWEGGRNPESLSPKDWQRFMLATASAVRAIEMAFMDWEEGRMSHELWSAQHQSLIFWFKQAGLRKFLDEYGATFYPPFTKYIREEVIDKLSDPMCQASCRAS